MKKIILLTIFNLTILCNYAYSREEFIVKPLDTSDIRKLTDMIDKEAEPLSAKELLDLYLKIPASGTEDETQYGALDHEYKTLINFNGPCKTTYIGLDI